MKQSTAYELPKDKLGKINWRLKNSLVLCERIPITMLQTIHNSNKVQFHIIISNLSFAPYLYDFYECKKSGQMHLQNHSNKIFQTGIQL